MYIEVHDDSSKVLRTCSKSFINAIFVYFYAFSSKIRQNIMHIIPHFVIKIIKNILKISKIKDLEQVLSRVLQDLTTKHI